MGLNDHQMILIEEWLDRAKRRSFAHHFAGEKYMKRHIFLGFPVVITTALLGITSQGDYFDGDWPLLSLSALATVLVSIQTFFNFSELADRHRRVGASWEGVKMELEEGLYIGSPIAFDMTRAKIKGLLKDSPYLSNRIWKRACKKYERP